MQPMSLKVVGGAIVVKEKWGRGGGGGGSMVFVEGPRGRDGNHPLARAVQWHGARAALHRLGDGAAVCVRLRKRHRIGSRGVVLIEIPCQAVAGD